MALLKVRPVWKTISFIAPEVVQQGKAADGIELIKTYSFELVSACHW
jgi:hypothetical protein